MLTPELEAIRTQIEQIAKDYGLDFYTTIFELLDYRQISEIAAYGGFPTRYPHWRYGMEYEKLYKGYIFGGQRIYEMVINNNPCYAYLLNSNPVYDQKTVMAHVYGHCDFFKNNLYFSATNRKMIDEMANHAARIRRYIDRFGIEEVETFLDQALSLENLIDPHATHISRKARPLTEEEQKLAQEIPRIKTKKYMENYVNPKEYIEAQQEKMRKEKEDSEQRFPVEPVRDVLEFLIDHAPLKDWQQDILSIIREEAYYFAPQWMTKIMNEGWAVYWHSQIMTKHMVDASEIISYADHHSGVIAMSKGNFNPYKVGLELFLDIEERWNKGRFGREYAECDNMSEKLNWDKQLGLGREKMFEVRKLYNDVTFIDEFLTPEFCIEHKLFTYGYNKRQERWEVTSRRFEDIKQMLLTNLTNGGNPFIYVTDGNYQNRGELYLVHQHEGVDLKLDYARDTLRNLERVWHRPVVIETVIQESITQIRFDGQNYSIEQIGEIPKAEEPHANGIGI